MTTRRTFMPPARFIRTIAIRIIVMHTILTSLASKYVILCFFYVIPVWHIFYLLSTLLFPLLFWLFRLARVFTWYLLPLPHNMICDCQLPTYDMLHNLGISSSFHLRSNRFSFDILPDKYCTVYKSYHKYHNTDT